jgi:acetyltransferase-like isoleucine patch superfamily enzyme
MSGATLDHDWFPRPLPSNVTLDERTWCYSSFAFLHHRSQRPEAVRVGRDTGIYNGTFFDLGPDGEVTIGDYCTLVGAIIATNRRVTIGDYCFLAHEVVLADDTFATPAHGTPGDRQPGITLADNCWVGARAVLLAGTRIGEGSVVGAAAVVRQEVPPFTIVAGNPARVVGQVRRAKP